MPPHPMVEESEWLDASQRRWRQLGYVPQDDLKRFCGDYIPAMMRSSPTELRHISVTVEWMGRTGVHWIRQVMDWQFDELPQDGAITVVCEGMRREVERIGACNRVRGITCDIDMVATPRENIT